MSSPTGGPEIRFDATLEGSATGSATGIEVPADLLATLGQGRRPPVQATLNDLTYRTTIGVMGGRHLLPVSADIRKRAGLTAGDVVQVTLRADTTPRAVVLPAALAAAFEQHPAAREFFGTLSNSLQRYHVDSIDSAKSDETRQRRVDKAIQLFLAGKPR